MVTTFQTLIQFIANTLQSIVDACHRNAFLQFSLVVFVMALVLSVFSVLWKRGK